MQHTFQGIAASSGLAIAPIWIYHPIKLQIIRKEGCQPNVEWQRIDSALTTAHQQLQILREEAQLRIGQKEAEIFEAHQVILRDPDLLATIQENLTSKRYNAEIAIQDSVNRYANMLLALEGTYFQERAQDVLDLGSA